MSTAELPRAPLRLRVDTHALAGNWRTLSEMSGKAQAGAAVKANAYGVGVGQVVPCLRDAGCEQFYVAHWSEVPALLSYVPARQVAMLHGVTDRAEADYARATGVMPVINSIAQAELWLEAGGGPCHLMVDTGINRLGIGMADTGNEAIGRLKVDMLLSHLASADEDSALNAVQLGRFREVSTRIDHQRRSLANSAGIALGADYHFEHTRPGLSLYGGVPRQELEGRISQVVFPEAAVIQRRRIAAGDSVGYNATFTANRDMEVATVSIGYADGFLRSRGRDCALQHGNFALPIIGRVSMDMVVLDCTGFPDLKMGDFLQIPFDLPRVSETSGLSQYELLTTLGDRFALHS